VRPTPALLLPLLACMQKTDASVIVVGAGLSGLSAAHALVDSGASVIVLEARDRAGGRVWTDRETFPFPVERGANWLEGDAAKNPLDDLFDEAGVETYTSDYEAMNLYDQDGSLVDADTRDAAWADPYDAVIDGLFRAKDRVDADESVADALDDLDAWTGLGAARQRQVGALFWWEHDLSCAYTRETAGLYGFDEDGEMPGDFLLATNGLDHLIDSLSEGLDIRLSEPVSAVRYGADGVEVDSALDSYAADYVVVTVPLGVLERGEISFDPALPASHQDAIDAMDMGTIDKAFLHFPSSFWPSDRDFLLTLDPEGYDYTVEWTLLEVPLGEPMVLGMMSRKYALELEDLDDAAVEARLVAQLQGVFGDAVPEPDGFLFTRHASTPYQYGSYAFWPVGAGPEDSEALAEPVDGRLYFAGEHTSADYLGEMHGAWISGQDAARALLRED